MIKLIVAYDENMLIGKDNDLPWNIKDDLEHFKNTTLNKNILLGKTTYEMIPSLKNRNIFVLSYEKNLHYKNEVTVIDDYQDIIRRFGNNYKEDIYICGGESIYNLFIPFVDEMIISHIKGKYQGNKYFPNWNEEEFINYKNISFNEFKVSYYKKNKKHL